MSCTPKVELPIDRALASEPSPLIVIVGEIVYPELVLGVIVNAF